MTTQDHIDFLICRAEICESADVSCIPEAQGLREAAAELSRLRTALEESQRDGESTNERKDGG